MFFYPPLQYEIWVYQVSCSPHQLITRFWRKIYLASLSLPWPSHVNLFKCNRCTCRLPGGSHQKPLGASLFYSQNLSWPASRSSDFPGLSALVVARCFLSSNSEWPWWGGLGTHRPCLNLGLHHILPGVQQTFSDLPTCLWFWSPHSPAWNTRRHWGEGADWAGSSEGQERENGRQENHEVTSLAMDRGDQVRQPGSQKTAGPAWL